MSSYVHVYTKQNFACIIKGNRTQLKLSRLSWTFEKVVCAHTISIDLKFNIVAIMKVMDYASAPEKNVVCVPSNN